MVTNISRSYFTEFVNTVLLESGKTVFAVDVQ